MKKILSLILFILLIFSGCSEPQENKETTETTKPTTATTVPVNPEMTKELDLALSNVSFKGVACIYSNGNRIYEGYKGYADLDKKVKNSSQITYRIGSLSKQFTAVCIGILYEKDEISLDQKLIDFYPECKYGNDVTIKSLLNMTAGIPDYSCSRADNIQYSNDELGFEISTFAKEDNIKNIEEFILNQTPNNVEKGSYDYSNSNYFLLGRIIEKVSNMDYEAFVNENILEPLNMKNTSFEQTSLTSTGYYKGVNEFEVLKEFNQEWTLYPGAFFANADMISSADDLFRWYCALKNNEIITQNTFDILTKNSGSGFGMGMITDNPIVYFINGHIGAYTSFLGFSKTDDFAVITLSNHFSDDVNYNNIGAKLGNIAIKYEKQNS
ncbi:MAG: serine hydrolase [Oscillospiraceae bacterium]|nr:serine hydrolase [Oscillospiraceae bacterium]